MGVSLVTKSYEVTTRSIISISALILFVLLLLGKAIEWHMRWYAFAGLLLILAIQGVVSLFSQKKISSKEFKIGRVIQQSAVMTLLFALTLTPPLLFPEYEQLPVTGSYAVATRLSTYTDHRRLENYSDKDEYRRLTVQHWYPAHADTTFPLIVFSHGAFGVRSSNLSLYRELASNGYVVASIDHTYHAWFATDTDGRTVFINSAYMKEILNEDAHTDREQSYAYYQKWMDIRMRDINFVIDHIFAEAGKDGEMKPYALVDMDRLGLAGHSLGGSAALGVVRSRADVSAVMALESPYLFDITGVESGEFIWNNVDYPSPVLNVYSDSSWNHFAGWSQYSRNVEMLKSNSPDVHNTYLQGTGHLSLTDLALTSPILTRILNGHPTQTAARVGLIKINQIALEFFNRYLK